LIPVFQGGSTSAVDAAVAGIETAAGKLGRGRAWTVHAGLLGGAIGLAILSLPAVPAGEAQAGGVPSLAALVLGVGLIAAGLALGRGGGPRSRERAWELEALGVAVFGAGWVAAVAALR